MSVTLHPAATDLKILETVWRNGTPACLSPKARDLIKVTAAHVRDAAKDTEPVYGINTGYGKLAPVSISPQDNEALQRNLVLSNCCWVGDPLDAPTVRLMMTLKLLSLGRGASGVRWEVCASIEAMLDRGIKPMVPTQDSAGAYGDLAPLAHMAAVMTGEGETFFEDKLLPRGIALDKARLSLLVLGLAHIGIELPQNRVRSGLSIRMSRGVCARTLRSILNS